MQNHNVNITFDQEIRNYCVCVCVGRGGGMEQIPLKDLTLKAAHHWVVNLILCNVTDRLSRQPNFLWHKNILKLKSPGSFDSVTA